MSQKLLAFAVVLLAAAGAAAETNSVAVRDAWARATPGKAANGAVYLTLEAAVRDRLTGLATPVAKKAELHAMTMEGGVMKMRLLAGVDLPPGQAISLQPGAAHIMLVGDRKSVV